MKGRLCLLGLLAILVSLLAPALCLAASFKRGDANADGNSDLSDAVKTLNVLFLGSIKEDCDDAMDTNDDGSVDISDGVFLLNYLFLGGKILSAPYPDCGADLTEDGLGCSTYPHCVDCLDQSDLDAIIAENVADTVCIPQDAAQLTALIYNVTVCPAASAPDCGPPPEKGCPIHLTTIDAELDIAAEEVRIHLVGNAADLPILLENTSTGSTTTCSTDISFDGNAVVPFTATSNPDGSKTVGTLGDPVIDSAEITLTSEGEFLCDVLESMQDTFKEQLIAQLQESAAGLINDLRPELEGQILCPAP